MLKKAAIEAMSASGTLYEDGEYAEAKRKAKVAWDFYLMLQKQRAEDEDFSDLIYASRALYEKCEGAIEATEQAEESDTTEELDLDAAVAAAREQLKPYPKVTGDGEVINAFWELACGDVLMAEKYIREGKNWVVSAHVEEFIKIASQLEGYDHMIQNLYSACSRLEKALPERPRLKQRFYQLFQLVTNRLECQIDHELGASEDIMHEISQLNSNIGLYEQGHPELIRNSGHLKHDPVEWSARWEEVIDDAEHEANEQLADMPRGMGFCHAYWPTLRNILKEKYDLDWRTPAEMNPGVLFD